MGRGGKHELHGRTYGLLSATMSRYIWEKNRAVQGFNDVVDPTELENEEMHQVGHDYFEGNSEAPAFTRNIV